jgi:UTP--glucose-1-phosphate uridylyltransferase
MRIPVVIPAAGLGTRLLPFTKEQPKEMLPIFVGLRNAGVALKPVIQTVYESTYDAGLREFCFVVGRGKRVIEDHFAYDQAYLSFLRRRRLRALESDFRSFYRKLESSTITFINQPDPKGFGEAVYRARHITGNRSFLVHAGDDYIITPAGSESVVRRLLATHTRLSSTATFLVERAADPRRYGVAEGRLVERGVLRVRNVEEKPSKPRSNLGIVGVYAFEPTIYPKIRHLSSQKEIQLTDSIKALVDDSEPVYAIMLHQEEKRVEIGTPEAYFLALRRTLAHALAIVRQDSSTVVSARIR